LLSSPLAKFCRVLSKFFRCLLRQQGGKKNLRLLKIIFPSNL